MASTQPHYLRACLAAFREVIEAKYRRSFDLAAIERKVAPLRSKKTLTYQDLQYFESKEHWWFEGFWVFPPEQHVGPALEQKTFPFWNARKNESSLIRELLDVFKSIEHVSIILRFLRPEYFGIISPPVERVLDLRRGSDAAETYEHYLSNLREIQTACGFKRTADADMALWVLHERCFGEHRDADIARAYNADPLLLRMRARNLVLPLAQLSPPRLANALGEAWPDLAVVIACYALELQIRQVAERLGAPGGKLDKLIDNLPNYGPVDQLRKDMWKRLKGMRDDLFHKGQKPNAKGRADLLKEVVRLEEEIAKLQQNRGRPGV